MGEKWKIDYYETDRGDKPVQIFIEAQDEKTQTKIVRILEHLEEFGTQVGAPRELRILGTNNIRIFYVAIKEQKFLLVHAFKKKKQKTDKREVRLAQERLAEYQTRRNN